MRTKRDEIDLPEDPYRLGAMTLRLMMAFPNWSRSRLADQTGYDPKLIALWVRGLRDPKPTQLAAIAKVTGASLPQFEDFARTAIRLRGRHGQGNSETDFAGLAEEAGQRVAAIVGTAIPELEALIEEGLEP